MPADPSCDRPGRLRLLAATGGVFAATAVALSAYAAHAADPAARAALQSAALFAFGHGIALAALAPRAGRLAAVSLAVLALGTVLFSGSIVAQHLAGTPTTLAPVGGVMMILAWLLWAGRSVVR